MRISLGVLGAAARAPYLEVARRLAVLFLITFQAAAIPAIAAQDAVPGSYAKGRILVMPRPGLPDAELEFSFAPNRLATVPTSDHQLSGGDRKQ